MVEVVPDMLTMIYHDLPSAQRGRGVRPCYLLCWEQLQSVPGAEPLNENSRLLLTFPYHTWHMGSKLYQIMLYSYIHYHHKKSIKICDNPTASNIEMLRNGHTKIHMKIHRHVQRTQQKLGSFSGTSDRVSRGSRKFDKNFQFNRRPIGKP